MPEFFDDIVPASPLNPSNREDIPITATGFEAFEQSRLPRPIEIGLPLAAGVAGTAIGGPLAGAGAAGLTALGVNPGDPMGALLEAGSNLAGGIVGKGVGVGLSRVTRSSTAKFIAKKAIDVTNLIKKNVPAWRSFQDGAKGLVQMFQGQNVLSQAFDTSLKGQIEKATGKPLVIPIQDATNLNIPISQIVSGPVTGSRKIGALRSAGVVGPPTHAVVDAGDAAQAIIGKSEEFPASYTRIAESLVRAGVGNAEDRNAYKWGIGTIQYLNATKALEGEEFRLDRAMAGLLQTKTFDMLRRRGMIDLAKVIRGTEKSPLVKQGSIPAVGTLGGIAGVAANEAIQLQHPFLAFMAGRSIAEGLTKRGFRGVPLNPSAATAKRFLPAVGGLIGQTGLHGLLPGAEEP